MSQLRKLYVTGSAIFAVVGCTNSVDVNGANIIVRVTNPNIVTVTHTAGVPLGKQRQAYIEAVTLKTDCHVIEDSIRWIGGTTAMLAEIDCST